MRLSRAVARQQQMPNKLYEHYHTEASVPAHITIEKISKTKGQTAQAKHANNSPSRSEYCQSQQANSREARNCQMGRRQGRSLEIP